MSKYTVQLRWLVEQYIADTLHDGISQDQWPNAYPRLGLAASGNSYNLTPYPIFDEAHRQVLNDAIIRHYWNYEIGSETPDMFAWNLNDALHRIMPYYNSLFAAKLNSIMEIVTEKWNVTNTDDIVRKILNATTGTADTKYDQSAKYTMDRTATGTLDTDYNQTDKTVRERNDTSETDTTSTSKEQMEDEGTSTSNEKMQAAGTNSSTDRFLDTPQSSVQNLDDGWLTNARKIDGETTDNRTTDTTGSTTENRTTDTNSTGHEETTATQNETTDYTSNSTTDTDTSEKVNETGNSSQNSTTDLDTTSNSDTDDTTDRDLTETGWRIDPQDWEKALTTAKELFNIDRMIVEDDAVRECFMLVW